MHQLIARPVVLEHKLLVLFPTSRILGKLFSIIFVPDQWVKRSVLAEVTNFMLSVFGFGWEFFTPNIIKGLYRRPHWLLG